MKRILTSELARHVGARVRIAGWLHHQRRLGGVTFLLVRDRAGLVHVVVDDPAQRTELAGLWPQYGGTRVYYTSRMGKEKTAPPVSTRYPSDTLRRLDRRAEAEGRSRSTLIQRYVAEGIEMDEHPGIVFRSGPAGRRPGLAGGPDVWEVVAVHRAFENPKRTADWLDQPATAIETALRYYEAHRAEIDEWIRRNEEAAEAAERVARARQAAS